MTRPRRALVLTFAVVSIVTVALAVILALPASGLKPLRTGVLDLDQPASTSSR